MWFRTLIPIRNRTIPFAEKTQRRGACARCAFTLRLPTGIVRGWISTLVAFTDMGLFVQAGLSKDASRMDYVVAELDLSEHVLKPIVSLPATFI